MADTELDIPSLEPSEDERKIEQLLIKHLETSQRKTTRGDSTVNILFCFAFAIGGMAAFLTAYQVAFSPGSATGDTIIGSVLCGVGVLCWGIAWVGSMIENKV